MRNFKFLITCIIYSVSCVLLYACATTPDTESIKKGEAHYKLGISYLDKNQLKESFIEFQKAIKLNPRDKYSFYALGYISTRFKEYDEAISYYNHALSIDPDYSEAMNNLGVLYLEVKKWDEAIKYFKMTLKNPLYPTPDIAYSNIGYALYKKGDYPNAVNTLKEALERYPGSAQASYVLALVYIEMGKIEAAIDMLNKTVTITPGYIDAHWELANAYLRIGNREKALSHFKMVAESDSGNERRQKALEYIELLKQ